MYKCLICGNNDTDDLCCDDCCYPKTIEEFREWETMIEKNIIREKELTNGK